MNQFYKLMLIVLILIVIGLAVYIFLRRAYVSYINEENLRRENYWRSVINDWLYGSSSEAERAVHSSLSKKDLDALYKICLERARNYHENDRDKLLLWLDRHGYIDGFIKNVSSTSRWERARAIENLGLLRYPKAESVLVSALDDPVLDVRVRAAKALGLIGGHRARQALVSALSDEGRWSVIQIADILGQMGALVANDLIEAFPRLGSRAKLAALDTIIRLANSTHLQFLLSCVADTDAEVRTRAVSGLGRIGNVTALPRLLLALHDQSWPVRAKAARALGDLGIVQAIPSLIECLSDAEWWVRCNAAESLSKLGDEGNDALFNSLSSNDVFCRDQAFYRLQSTGALNLRLEGILSTNPEKIAKAQNLLARLIEHLSPQEFIDFCESFPNPILRLSIWEMFQRYSGREESAA